LFGRRREGGDGRLILDSYAQASCLARLDLASRNAQTTNMSAPWYHVFANVMWSPFLNFKELFALSFYNVLLFLSMDWLKLAMYFTLLAYGPKTRS
jgi:hypothetical protein